MLIAARCSSQKTSVAASTVATGFTLDPQLAAQDLAEWTRYPHAFGSARQQEIIAWLQQRLTAVGLKTAAEAFTAQVPNPLALDSGAPVASTLERRGTNVYAMSAELAAGTSPAKCVILLATHTDTKDIAGVEYHGANDSGSSSVLLLQLLPYLQKIAVVNKLPCAVVGAFFDGEEAMLPNWNDGETLAPVKAVDHTYGSRFAAQRLSSCARGLCVPKELGGLPLRALILLDMVGSPGLRLSLDSHSSPELVQILKDQAQALGYADILGSRVDAIDDDHVPFRKRGVAAIDLIDFEHLAYWHRPGDDAEHVDMASLQTAGRLAAAVLAAIEKS